MKPNTTYPEHFKKSSVKTPEQIRMACERLESAPHSDYIVKHNGKHIWIEVAQTKQEVWSPLLHLEVKEQDDSTFVKGQYVENPALWATLLATRLLTFGTFSLSLASSLFKWFHSEPFATELSLMFAMVTAWFAIYLIGKFHKRRSAKQAAELRDFADHIVA